MIAIGWGLHASLGGLDVHRVTHPGAAAHPMPFPRQAKGVIFLQFLFLCSAPWEMGCGPGVSFSMHCLVTDSSGHLLVGRLGWAEADPWNLEVRSNFRHICGSAGAGGFLHKEEQTMGTQTAEPNHLPIRTAPGPVHPGCPGCDLDCCSPQPSQGSCVSGSTYFGFWSLCFCCDQSFPPWLILSPKHLSSALAC